MTNANLAALSAAGVSVWLDDLSRQLLASGELEKRMAEYSIVGVTTNPAIFQSALADSSAYESALAEACLLYTSPSPRDRQKSRMPSSA